MISMAEAAGRPETPETPGEPTRRRFLGVAVENYAVPGRQQVSGAGEQMRVLGRALAGFGFDCTLVADPTITTLRERLAGWRTGGTQQRPQAVLVAWSGHAVNRDGTLDLLAADSDTGKDDTLYKPATLVEHGLAVSDQVLVVLDT
jgi:hypothetical protein